MGPHRRTQGQGRHSLNDRLSGLPALCRTALARAPSTPAIEFEGRWWTWGDLARLASELSSALAAIPGPEGAPVVLVPRNHPDSIAALLALLAEGRTVRMVYAFQSAEGIARDLAERDACAVVAHEQDFDSKVCQAIAARDMAGIALADGRCKNVATAPGPCSVAVPKKPAIEILTSGTTGPPKRFAVGYDLLEQHFVGASPSVQAESETDAAPPLLLSFPLANITGLYVTLPTILRGQRIVLLERFRLGAWIDYVRRHRPTHTGLPPSCVQELLDAAVPPGDLASVRALGVGAAPLNPGVQAAFEDRYGIPILVSYGATEFAGPVTSVSAADHALFGRTKLGTVGRALPGVRLRIVDPDTGSELEPGYEGLLEVVSPRIGLEWIRTTDLAVIDDDGFLFVRGRADGAINRGGFKVIPESLESALMLHPGVSEAAVVGIPDRRLGEVPAAAIRRAPGAAIRREELEAHLRVRFPAPSIPAKWLFCGDFPRTPSHKVDRAALRQLFADRPSEAGLTSPPRREKTR